MTTRAQRHRDLGPVRRALHGWSFSTLDARRGMVERAKTIVPELPESVREEARKLIADVAEHCTDGKD